MLNSAQHEILMLVSIKISRKSAFLGSDKLRMLFFLLINVKMPTILLINVKMPTFLLINVKMPPAHKC